MVVDVTKRKNDGAVFAQNEYGAYCARYLRVDFTNGKMTDGGSIDVAYVGFSDSISEIIAVNGDVASIDLFDASNSTPTSISTKDYALPIKCAINS